MASRLPSWRTFAAYAAAVQVDGRSYAVEGGRLYGGVNGAWVQLPSPRGVIVNAVAVDRLDSDSVFIGAADRPQRICLA